MNQSVASVDASVAVKWVVTAEDFADRASALLRDSLQLDRVLVGPPHLAGEVANGIYQRARSREPARHLTEDEAREALTQFLNLPLQVITPAGLYTRAFDFAREYDLPSMYDSLYVVLAQILSVDLWTADRRLLAALGTRASWVRFIGDYPA